jgi:hypothetical protein
MGVGRRSVVAGGALMAWCSGYGGSKIETWLCAGRLSDQS